MVWITGGCENRGKDKNDAVICGDEAKFPNDTLGTINIIAENDGHFEFPEQVHNRESGFSYTTYQGDRNNAILPGQDTDGDGVDDYNNSIPGTTGNPDNCARGKVDQLIREYIEITDRRF